MVGQTIYLSATPVCSLNNVLNFKDSLLCCILKKPKKNNLRVCLKVSLFAENRCNYMVSVPWLAGHFVVSGGKIVCDYRKSQM